MSWASFFAGKSPAAWWRVGESAGATVATDASGNGRDATYKAGANTFGVAGSVANDSDTAITVGSLVAGTTAYSAFVADASWMNQTGAVTFACSVKTTQAAIFLLTRWDAATVANCYAALDLSGGKARWYGLVAGQSSVIATGATTVNDNAWHRIIGVFDGATLKVYVDGVLDGTGTPTGAGPFSLQTPTVGRGLMIGGRYATTGNTQNPKTLDEPAFIPGAWSAADVLADYREWSGKYAGDASGAHTSGGAAAGVVAKSTTASAAETSGATAAGVVATTAGATAAETSGGSAAGAVVAGLSGDASGAHTSGATGDGVTATSSGATAAETAGGTAAGAANSTSGATGAHTSGGAAAGGAAATTGATGAHTSGATATGAVNAPSGATGAHTAGGTAAGTVDTGGGSTIRFADGTALINPRFADGTTLIVRGWLDADGTTIHPFT